MQRLRDTLQRGRFIFDLNARDPQVIMRTTVEHLVELGAIPPELSEAVIAALLARERTTPTAIGHGVAIPHVYLEGCPEAVIVFVRLAAGVNLGAPDGIPTRLMFFLLGPPVAAAQHLDTLAQIARLAADAEFRFDAVAARTSGELLVALDRFSARTARPQVRAKREDALAYSGRLCGGFISDVKARLRTYPSDFTDGLHPKSAGSALFLFFACLAPAVTFGGIMAAQTGGSIGVVEMLVATALCGVLYALFAGQPLIILGGTGPLLVFTAVLYRFCEAWSIPFLPAYAWVGLWSALLVVILALTDASCLMRYFTRFTDEIFAALISLIFVYEAIRALVLIFRDPHKPHDTALLSLLLALGTFYIAINLSRFRRSRFLLPKVREFLADFGTTIALATMALVAYWLHEVDLDTLRAPATFGTTNGRPWLVSLSAAPVWVRCAALGPALLVTVLVYLDQNITARLVDSPGHKLRKRPAYHLDLAVVGVLLAICSLFGWPWLVAATVRSLNHVRSLATVEEITGNSGPARERVLQVRETRVTGLAIHILIALALILLPLLKHIPLAVLYGLFLFMGVVSMAGNQFFERLSLWIMDSALYPTTHYIRRVPRRVIHLFTGLQLACLVVMWVVQSSPWAIAFPLFIALLVPIRLLAGRYFAPAHLAALDADEAPEDEETHWV